MNSPATAQQLSQTVIEVVAEAENVDPIDLETPLYEVIDPDALEALFEPADEAPRPKGEVVFEYCGHTVTVESDGTVMVSGGSTPLEKPQ